MFRPQLKLVDNHVYLFFRACEKGEEESKQIFLAYEIRNTQKKNVLQMDGDCENK